MREVAMNHAKIWTGLPVAVALAAGCVQDKPQPTAVASVLTSSLSPKGPITWSIDERFKQIAQEVPGFGGVFFDKDGVLNVQLVDPSQADRARVAVADFLNRIAARSRNIRVVPARFNFSELDGWRNEVASRVFEISGVVSLDVDEVRNRVVIGIADQTASGPIETTLGTLGIPRGAVVVEQTPPIRKLSTLNDRIRPVQGGLHMEYSGWICSLGFNAYSDSIRGYVTASHCTDVQGGVEGTVHYQAHNDSPTDANKIGIEYADPVYTPCLAGSHRCRLSDASFGQYLSAVTSTAGVIARTQLRDHYLGSTTIDPLNPEFHIRAKESYSVSGETIEKVGERTGWTFGTITSTCVSIVQHDDQGQDTGVIVGCQDLADGGDLGGDSGSPIFYWGYDGQQGGTDVTVAGVLWGGNSLGTEIAFSPLGGVESELGTLDPLWNGPLAVTLTGPTGITQKGTYTWTAAPSGSTRPYNYQWSIFYYNSGLTQTLGTFQQQQVTVRQEDGDFDLRVIVVSSSGETRGDTVHVANCISLC